MIIEPKVSIVIPVYNGSNYVGEAIDTALAQTYKNLEIIVVNDGSTDNGKTDEICRSYGDRIKYFVKENGKCSSALNYGISKMTGEYFSWLSHDDLYCEDKIEKQIEAIKKYDIDSDQTVIGCASILVDKNGTYLRYRKNSSNGNVSGKQALQDLLLKQTPNGNGFLISKKILQTVGCFDTSLIFINDWDYWLRISLKGFTYFYLPYCLVKTRIHQAQQTKKLYGLRHDEIVRTISDRLKQEPYDSDCYKIIYCFCCYFGDKKLKTYVKNIVNEKGIRVSFFKSCFYFLYGGIIRFLKKIKHYLVYKQ